MDIIAKPARGPVEAYVACGCWCCARATRRKAERTCADIDPSNWRNGRRTLTVCKRYIDRYIGIETAGNGVHRMQYAGDMLCAGRLQVPR